MVWQFAALQPASPLTLCFTPDIVECLQGPKIYESAPTAAEETMCVPMSLFMNQGLVLPLPGATAQ